jgi:ATP-dependent RNA helicase RhlE
MKFTDLNIIPPILKALEKKDFENATKIQEEAIPLILEEKDVLGCAQTGSWKTLAFAIPILQNLYNRRLATWKIEWKLDRKIQTLILAPTRELADQIWDSFKPICTNTNLKYTVIFGGKSQFHQVSAIKKGVEILIATPGRLIDLIEQKLIDLSYVEIFTLDEADKMLNMWFLPDIEKVIKLLPKQRQSLFFSATMPNRIKKLADKILREPEIISVDVVSSTAENVKQELFHVNNTNKRQLLQYLIKKEEYKSIIVFVKTKDDTETVLDYVKSAEISCDNIHRNRSQNARIKALNKLKTWEIKVLVATDILSRGLDIVDLSCVINYDMPQEAETYVHRIGRTARAGKNWIAISLCNEAQKPKLFMIEKLIWESIKVNNDEKYKEEEIKDIKKVWEYSFWDKKEKYLKWWDSKKKRYYWKNK